MLNLLIFVCLLYVGLLFAVAFIAEKAAMRGRGRWLRSAWMLACSFARWRASAAAIILSAVSIDLVVFASILSAVERLVASTVASLFLQDGEFFGIHAIVHVVILRDGEPGYARLRSEY